MTLAEDRRLVAGLPTRGRVRRRASSARSAASAEFAVVATDPLMLVASSGRQRGWRLAAKRGLDVLVAGTLLVILSPVLGLIATWIRIDSPGPVVFRQQRIGRGGGLFTIYKFRSMRVDADPEIHRRFLAEHAEALPSGEHAVAHFKVPCDDRITRAGKILRPSSLDELPQLINVLRGEMSLVGPRPDITYSLEQYEARHYRRFEVLPGLTGLWQVSGRSRLSYRQMLDLDLDYVDRWSVGLDLRLLVRTVPELLRPGAAG